MDDNLDVIFNTISQQSKDLTNKVTPGEWNFIVNTLSKQSNHNAGVLKNLKILCQKIIESGNVRQEEINEIKRVIQIIKELDTRVKDNADNIALKVNTSDIVNNLTSTDTNKPLSANQGKVLKDAVDLLDTRVDTLEINKYNFVNFDEGMGNFDIDKDCRYDTIYLNLQSGVEGTFPDGYGDGGFLIQTQDMGNEYPIQTLFSPAQGKIYSREAIGYGDTPEWGEWKEFYGERSAFVQYQSNSGWAKIAQIRVPADNSQRESITFLVTAEDNTSVTAERYTGILELNTHENAASSSLKWLVVSGFGLSNFNLRLNEDRLEVWVLPTVGTMSFAVLSETMSGKDVRFIELFDVSEPAPRTGTSLGNSEKLTIMTNAEIKSAYESNANTNAYTNADKAKVDLIKTNGDGSRYLADDGEYHELIRVSDMAYFNYASSIYGAKYNLLASAWERSLIVNPSEISVDSLASNPRGKAQYPNGETEGVIIPHGVTRIGDFAFYNWTSNNQPLVIPNSVTIIDGYAFYKWTSNNHPLVIPDSVTFIGTYAFSNWTSVPYIEMKGTTPPSLSANPFSNQNNAPIYVPHGSVEAYKTASNWTLLADRIFSIKDK